MAGPESWDALIAEESNTWDDLIEEEDMGEVPGLADADIASGAVGPLLGAPLALEAAVLKLSPDVMKSIQTHSLPSSQVQQHLHPILQAFANASEEGAVPLNVDPEVQSLCKFYLHNAGPQLHTSKVALSNLLSVEPDHIESKLGLIVNTLLHTNGYTQHSLEEILAQSGAHLLAYFECSRYDETPMRVRHRQHLHDLLDSKATMGMSNLGFEDDETLACSHWRGPKL